jgi:hypothetical protein
MLAGLTMHPFMALPMYTTIVVSGSDRPPCEPPGYVRPASGHPTCGEDGLEVRRVESAPRPVTERAQGRQRQRVKLDLHKLAMARDEVGRATV